MLRNLSTKIHQLPSLKHFERYLAGFGRQIGFLALLLCCLATACKEENNARSYQTNPDLRGEWLATLGDADSNFSFPHFYRLRIALNYMELVDMDFIRHKCRYDKDYDSIYCWLGEEQFDVFRYKNEKSNLILKHGTDSYLYQSTEVYKGLMSTRPKMSIALPKVKSAPLLKPALIHEKADFRHHHIHYGINEQNVGVLMVEGVQTQYDRVAQVLRMGDGRRKRTHIVKLFADEVIPARIMQKVVSGIQEDGVDSVLVMMENRTATFENAHGKFYPCATLAKGNRPEEQTWGDFLRELPE